MCSGSATQNVPGAVKRTERKLWDLECRARLKSDTCFMEYDITLGV